MFKKNMKIKIVLFLLCCSIYSISAQTKSGMILSGGNGNFRDIKQNDYRNEGDFQNKYTLGVGYRFRIQPKNPSFFYDLDLNLGLKHYNYAGVFYHEMYDNMVHSSGKLNFLHVSLNGSYNYKMLKGLYAGIGIEPTVYYIDVTSKYLFDIPLTAKLGYDLKYFGLEVGYKLGFTDVIYPSYFASGKRNDWQISLYIPF
jgi:hypothetical protein